MALIDKLSAIGDAIREKTGKDDLLTLDQMPGEIQAIETGGGGLPEVEPIVLTGNQSYGCQGVVASAYINMFGDTISTQKLTSTDFMFRNFTLEHIPFSLNYNNTTYRAMNSLFSGCNNLIDIPEMSNVYPENMGNLFEGCYKLQELPENFGADWNWKRLHTYAYAKMNNIFSYCRLLRKIPASIISNLWGIQTSTTYAPTYYTFSGCYLLEEVRNFPVQSSTLTSNIMTGIVNNCYRLSTFTFAVNDDGSAKTANWKNQTIDIGGTTSYPVGYAYLSSHIIANTNLTANTQVIDDNSYQLLKNNPDWWTALPQYSRYNHNSAVETINSLPDCSAYGTNTIKFKGTVGSATDGGAINTLTEEEIAVATAKGWTVSLV